MEGKQTAAVRISRGLNEQLGTSELRAVVEREMKKQFATRGDVVTYFFKVGVWFMREQARYPGELLEFPAYSDVAVEEVQDESHS